MIFYFSGQIPMTRPKSSKDEDILFFRERGVYHRLICLWYRKDSDTILHNLKLIEEKYDGNGKRKRPRRRS